MKKIFVLLASGIIFSGVLSTASAQDSTKSGVARVRNASAQGDKLYGRKIQQQTLSAHQFEKLDTIAVKKADRKTGKRRHRRC